MGKYFGTDGFRGEANLALTAPHAYKIGRYLGFTLGKEKRAKVVIGKDTRCSGDMLESALISGLNASGTDVYLLHVTTTPSVSYIVKKDGFDCGIMISASHNPFYDNGIKLINSRGEKIEAEIEEKIEAFIDERSQEDVPLARRGDIGRVIDYSIGKEKYIDHLAGSINCGIKDLKVAVDCSNGSASAVAKGLFEKIGINARIINDQPNGININDNCGSTHIDALRSYVKENGCDMGFALDGDADRCLAVDENGNAVDGDMIMFICGKYLKENNRLNNNTVVTTVMSNIGLYKALKRENIDSVRTDVGDKYVSEAMVAGDYSIGGEQSGHIIFREFASTGDGLLTALMLYEAAVNKNKTLGELAGEVKIYPQLLKNIRVKDKDEAMKNENVLAAVKKAEDELGDDGRILVRMSGTEPLIRVMAEAVTDETCRLHVENIIEVIRQEGLEE